MYFMLHLKRNHLIQMLIDAKKEDGSNLRSKISQDDASFIALGSIFTVLYTKVIILAYSSILAFDDAPACPLFVSILNKARATLLIEVTFGGVLTPTDDIVLHS